MERIQKGTGMIDSSYPLLTIDEYKKGLIRSIEIGIEATNMDDEYHVGLRNGMRVCKAYIDGNEPDYEDVTNLPLTWDELKQMVEEPVWIEYEHSNHRNSGKRWFIIKWFGDLMSFFVTVNKASIIINITDIFPII